MVTKLTDKSQSVKVDVPLTSWNNTPFILSFKYKLQNGYTFKNLKANNMKSFQHFLDKVAEMTFDQVDKEFLREPDKNDKYSDSQIQHYEIDEKFRVHGIVENSRFKVLRLDPNHSVHK